MVLINAIKSTKSSIYYPIDFQDLAGDNGGRNKDSVRAVKVYGFKVNFTFDKAEFKSTAYFASKNAVSLTASAELQQISKSEGLNRGRKICRV